MIEQHGTARHSSGLEREIQDLWDSADKTLKNPAINVSEATALVSSLRDCAARAGATSLFTGERELRRLADYLDARLYQPSE